MRKTICDRCGHEKQPTDGKTAETAWSSIIAQPDPVNGAFAAAAHYDICPWCKGKFDQYLASYMPGET